MIRPANLQSIDDKVIFDLCVKHINNGFLLGINNALQRYKESDEKEFFFREFFPRGFYGNYLRELYRIKDIVTSKMLYILGDFDKYVITSLLNFYCGESVSDYSLDIASNLQDYSDSYKKLSNCMNYHVIDNEENRDRVLTCFSKIAYVEEGGLEKSMAGVEDLSRYSDTCFESVDYLNLCDYSIDEIIALNAIRKYNFNIEKTRFYLPYTLIK